MMGTFAARQLAFAFCRSILLPCGSHLHRSCRVQVDGTIPAQLLGTFFRNGPGLQVDRPGHQRHTFDGDGMLLSMAFKDGKAFFRNRYVRTRGFVDEQVWPVVEGGDCRRGFSSPFLLIYCVIFLGSGFLHDPARSTTHSGRFETPQATQ